MNLPFGKMLMLIVIFVSFFACSTYAQFIMEEKEYHIPVNYDLLPEDTEFENPVDEAKYFLNLPEERLRAGAMDIEESTSTMYFDGENFAAEMVSAEEGKVTSIYDSNKKILYYVLWEQKKVFQMTGEDMKQMQKDTEAMKNKMMEGLSPEMRMQVEEQMKMDAKPKKSKVTSTGKKEKKYGFDCNQYLVESEEEIKMIWATDDLPGLRNSFEGFIKKMSAVFPSMEESEKDDWDLVGGKIPVETLTMMSSIDMMGTPEIEITALTKIKQTKPPSDKFVPPTAADGFSYGSMKNMMSQMMNLMQED